MEEQLAAMTQKYLEAQSEIQRLTKLIEDLQKKLQDSLEGNQKLLKSLEEMQPKLDALIAQSKKRKKKDYGKKTERFNPRPALTKSKPSNKEKSTGIKHILENATNLPSPEQVHHTVRPEESKCPSCCIETEFVSNTLTHELDMVSAKLKALEHLQETRACPKCKQYIVTAKKPPQSIPGSYAGRHLVGEIIVGKLDDGLPNYRQQKIFARHNIVIPRSTQCDWIHFTANTTSVLYDLQKKELFNSSVIKTDDSWIKIQDRERKDNMRKGKITAYVSDPKTKIVMYDAAPDLSFDKNLDFLKDFKGIVQADAAKGFDALFEDGQRTEAGCGAHNRRKYFDLEFTLKDVSIAVLEVYKELYEIEAEIKDKPAFKLAMRRRKSKPLMKRLRKIVVRERTRVTLNPSSDLFKAVNYTLNHWRALTRFLKNPDIDIDNNECERAIKTWVLVRKNSLFAGSDDGSRAIAIHLSFIATCKRNGINPVDWYADVLPRIHDLKITQTNELKQLLPQNWSPP